MPSIRHLRISRLKSINFQLLLQPFKPWFFRISSPAMNNKYSLHIIFAKALTKSFYREQVRILSRRHNFYCPWDSSQDLPEEFPLLSALPNLLRQGSLPRFRYTIARILFRPSDIWLLFSCPGSGASVPWHSLRGSGLGPVSSPELFFPFGFCHRRCSSRSAHLSLALPDRKEIRPTSQGLRRAGAGGLSSDWLSLSPV